MDQAPAKSDRSPSPATVDVPVEELDLSQTTIIKVCCPTVNVPEAWTDELLMRMARHEVMVSENKDDGGRHFYRTWIDIKRGALVHFARNDMVDPSASSKDDGTWYDYVLFIDSDMHWQDNGIIAYMASLDLPIVGGLCVRKTWPHKPTIYVRDPEDGRLKQPVLGPEAFDGSLKPEQRLLEVDAIGMGFTMIRRDVFEAIEPPWFWFGFEKLNGKTTYGSGEDVWFCEKAQRAGFKVTCDIGLHIGHIGPYIYSITDYIGAMTYEAEQMAKRNPKRIIKPRDFGMSKRGGRIIAPSEGATRPLVNV